ncbi:MAG: SDR family oxidoreductase, partial [Lentisphaeraceae bacterium]|nr:SDR family oxidoreductase [Lentisphaeraceae bacterium]
IIARDPQKINATATILRKNHSSQILPLSADLEIKSEMKSVISKVIEKWHGIDILINNVGGGGRWGTELIEDSSDQVWEEVMHKNAMTAVHFTRAFLPYMKKNQWGRIITITSIYGREGGGRPWFNMAKAAQTSLMKSLALKSDISRAGITCNSVAPGPILIPGTGWQQEKDLNSELWQQTINNSPLGRLGTPKEVADIVAFLASKNASLINGAAIAVDGGESKSF